MSNIKICQKINKMKSNTENYMLFNDFLNNLEQYKSKGDSLDIDNNKNCLQKNKISVYKYTKIDGSKSFLLDTINSIIAKDDLIKNLDNVKTIMDNLEFIADKSKYINYIQHQQNHSQKNSNKNISFSLSNNNIPKNLFFINKDNYYINNDLKTNFFLSEINNKNNTIKENEFNILDSKSNISEDTDEKKNPLKITERHKINKDNSTDELNITQKNTFSSLYRQDYYVKQFKVQYSIWLRNYLNQKLKQLINETKNCRKHLKFYPLNSLKFTANPKYEDNKIFLGLKIKEILIVGINSSKSSNQKKNKENIEIIENIIYKQNKNIKNDLLNFLNCTMEDSINIFYQSEQL